jgi:predicted GNAT family acetyltransferase
MTNDERGVIGDERLIRSVDGELEIVDVPERRRYEVRVGSRVVGHARYARSGQAITLVHTEVDPDQEGKGIASRLAVAVLADVTGRDLTVLVRCPFIAAYVRRHRADYPAVELRDN